MKRLLAAATLVFSPAFASAEGALAQLRASSALTDVEVSVPRGVPAGRIIPAAKSVSGERADSAVSGEGSVHGSATFNYRDGGIAGGRDGGRLGGGMPMPKNIPVEGEILVSGPDGAQGRIKVYGSVTLIGGAVTPNTMAHVGGDGPLYKDGKVVGHASVSGSGLANVQLMGDAFGRASAVITVKGSFTPAK